MWCIHAAVSHTKPGNNTEGGGRIPEFAKYYTNTYNNFLLVCVVSEATRNSLRGCKFSKFSGGACPQTPLVWVRCHARKFPPSMKNPCINPCKPLVHTYTRVMGTFFPLKVFSIGVCLKWLSVSKPNLKYFGFDFHCRFAAG